MSKKFKKIVLTIISLLVLVLGSLYLSNNFTSKTQGDVLIELIDIDGNISDSRRIDYQKGDTLVSLIESNYDNVLIENGMLMTIEDFETASDWSTFISIYVNDEMSMVGINDIMFDNNTKISFVMTEFVYE